MTPQIIDLIRDLSRTLADGSLEARIPISKAVYGQPSLAISSAVCYCSEVTDKDGCIVYRVSAGHPQVLRESILDILAQTLRTLAE